jgi:hypothetical protein
VFARRTDVGRIVGCAKDKLGRSVVAGADVGDVGLVRHEDLGATEIAKLEDARVGVEEEILGFDVAVADAEGVDVGE